MQQNKRRDSNSYWIKSRISLEDEDFCYIQEQDINGNSIKIDNL